MNSLSTAPSHFQLYGTQYAVLAAILTIIISYFEDAWHTAIFSYLIVQITYLTFQSYDTTAVTEWRAPSKLLMMTFSRVILWLFPIKHQGLDIIQKLQNNDHHDTPNHKILFVANHQVAYARDVFQIIALMYLHTGIFPRTLGDVIFSKSPLTKFLLDFIGGVIGNRENCLALMEMGEPLLVFPGGSHDALKITEEVGKYTLMWRDRVGFVKMAAKFDYHIIPLANIGFEDMLSTAFSFPADLAFSILGDYRAKKSKINSPRFKDGSPNIPLRIPVQYPSLNFQYSYYSFGEAISTVDCNYESDNDVIEMRDKVKVALERKIMECLQMQSADPQRYFKISKWLGYSQSNPNYIAANNLKVPRKRVDSSVSFEAYDL